MAPINDKTRILNAGTGIAAANGVPLYTPQKTFTFMKTIVAGGGFSALSVTYEGSLDGINWFTLGTDATTAAGVTFVVDKPCLFVRANVTAFTGGTSVTVDMVCMEQ